ncbi:MAG: FmdB family zinc ribbon protein [bacterium]
MPIYEYKCKLCNHSFEKLILRNNQPVVCPKCKGNDIQKLMSGSHVKSNSSVSTCFTPKSKGFT